MNIPDVYSNLTSRLRKLRRQEQLYQLLTRTGLLVFVVSCMAIVTPVLGHWGSESKAIRWFLLISSVCLLFYGVWQWLVRPLAQLFSALRSQVEVDLALRLGRRHDDIRDRFANALQVYFESLHEKTSRVRQALAAAALGRIYDKVKMLSFEEVLDRKTPRKRFYAGVFALLICGSIWGFAPGYMQEGLAIVLAPNRQNPKLGLGLQVTPGDTEIIKGEDLEIAATVDRPAPATAWLVWRTVHGSSANRVEMGRATDTPALRFKHTFQHQRQSIEYRVQIEDERSRWYRVEVLEPPVIRSLQIIISPPSYTRRAKVYQEDNLGDIFALPGSVVSLRLEANKKIEAGSVHFDWGQTVPLEFAENTGKCQFKVHRQGNYSIVLEDDKGLRSPDPIRYRIELDTDQYPVVRIVFPAQDVDLDESMKLPLAIVAEDDYGFSGMDLSYELISGF